jgi:excisionase family DNA binding protein
MQEHKSTQDQTARTITVFCTVSDIARSLKVSPQTILREIRAGELEAMKIRRQYRVGPGALQDYIRRKNILL